MEVLKFGTKVFLLNNLVTKLFSYQRFSKVTSSLSGNDIPYFTDHKMHFKSFFFLKD